MKISFKFVCLVYEVGSVWDWEFLLSVEIAIIGSLRLGGLSCPCQSAFADLDYQTAFAVWSLVL